MSNRQAVEEENLPGLLIDLSDILFHEVQKVIHHIWPKYPYISDELMISVLSSRAVTSSKKHIKEVHEHYHEVALSNFAEIKGDFGIVIKPSRVFELLKSYFPETVSSDPNVSSDTAALLDPTVKSIMKRFGKASGPPDAESKRLKAQIDFRQLIKLETMKRVADMHLSSVLPQYSVANENASEDVISVTLHVVIEQARSIPKMDLFRGADIFCVIFLEGCPDVFQTEIRSGISEKDWKWESELSHNFKWIMADNSELLNPERNIVVMVYDKDQLSEDDLIGCALVQLSELKEGHFSSWKKLIRPPNAPAREYLFLPAPKPEIKLQVSMTSAVVCSADKQSLRKCSLQSQGSQSRYNLRSPDAALSGDIVFLSKYN